MSPTDATWEFGRLTAIHVGHGGPTLRFATRAQRRPLLATNREAKYRVKFEKPETDITQRRPMFEKLPSKFDFPKSEESVLEFWKEHDIFGK